MLPLIGLAAGLSAGHRQSKERERERIRQEKNDAWQEEQRNVVRTQQQREAAMQTGLQEAAAPATVAPVEGSVLPPDQVGPSLALYRVKGNGIDQTTSDQAAATKSLADYNAPEAVATRQAGVLRAAGAPDKAMTLENSLSTAKLNKIKLGQAEQDEADRTWRRKLGAAMSVQGKTALDGLTDLFSDSEFGPMAGKKAKAVPSEDGKMVTIHSVNPDGSTTPTSLQFSNDQNGAIQAAYLLDSSITPEDRYKGWVTEVKNKQAATDKATELRIAQQRADAATLSAKNSGNKAIAAGEAAVSKEERVLYTNSLNEAGRNLREAQSTLSTLMQKPLFMMDAKEPGTPEAQQLRQLQDAVARYTEEQDMWKSLLNGSMGKGALGATPNEKSPAPNLPGGKPAASGKSGTPSYSNLWK